jgi:hypothetical protein
VVGVVGDHRRDQGAGVKDQRNGRGSKSSRLARALRSLRPALNAPISENGGCGASSPSSCSTAVLTNFGTATPRSSAALRARSKSLGSSSIALAGVAAMPGFYRRQSRRPGEWGPLGPAGRRNGRRTGAFTAALSGPFGREAAGMGAAKAPHSALASPLQQKTPRRGRRSVSGVTTGRRVIGTAAWQSGIPLVEPNRVRLSPVATGHFGA